MRKLKRKNEILMWKYDHGYFNIQNDERGEKEKID